MKKFSDFADVDTIEGDKIPVADVLNKEIVVLSFRIGESKFPKDGNSKFLKLQIQLDGEPRVVFTGSKVLMDQAERYKNEMPFIAVIKKVNKAYSFS